MNELQRTEYLSALGVTSFMPRFRLPLAPEPRQALLPEPLDTTEAAPSAVALTAAAPAQAQSAVRNPVAENHLQNPAPAANPALRQEIDNLAAQVRNAPLVKESVTAQSSIHSQAAEQATEAEQVQPFVLSCWWLGEELMVVDSRPLGTALPVESLFNSIARALGWHDLPAARDRLRWPMAEDPFAAAAAASDARDTCSVWLEAACARKPVKSIWLMGQQAQDFCSPVALAESPNAPIAEWNGMRILAMPSLSELLQEPMRKRELWQLLQQTYPEQTRA